jgi:hypothetical protein
VPTEAASEAYFERLSRVLAFARDEGWSGPTLTETAQEALA